MPTKSQVRCKTPHCIADIQRCGEHYHSVYDKTRDDCEQLCDRCGGKHTAGIWTHRCKQCGTDVAPGELVGLFVPHSCKKCLDTTRAEQIAKGQRCHGCGKPDCDCYC